MGELNILGITANDGIYKKIFGFKYIYKSDISTQNVDYVIALETNIKFAVIRKDIISHGFSDEAIIPVQSMIRDGFTVQK